MAMERWYTTVSYLGGRKNKKVDELNERLRAWVDNLIIGDDNLAFVVDELKELTRSLNVKHGKGSRSADLVFRQYGNIATIGYHCELCASITFHKIKRII